jgi:predicted permease
VFVNMVGRAGVMNTVVYLLLTYICRLSWGMNVDNYSTKGHVTGTRHVESSKRVKAARTVTL